MEKSNSRRPQGPLRGEEDARKGMEDIDLEKLEKKVWTEYFDDGWWEIMFGIIFITGYIRTVTDNVWFTGLIFVGVLVAVLGKWLITVPRLGKVEFKVGRIDRQMKMFLLLGVSVILLPILFIGLPEWGIWEIPEGLGTWLMALWIMAIFSLIAYFLDFKRIYLYGALFAAKELIWGNFGEVAGMWSSLILGIIVLGAGVVVLSRFLKKYPRVEKNVG